MNGFGTSPLELMAADAMLRGAINCEEFTYSANFFGTTALGANATVSVDTQINGDSDFIMTELNIISFTAADTIETNPDYTLLLVAAGSGRQLMDRAIHVLNMAGSYADNRVPAKLTFGRLMAAKNTITATLTNRSAVAANLVQIAYKGFKVFYTGGDRQQIFHAL